MTQIMCRPYRRNSGLGTFDSLMNDFFTGSLLPANPDRSSRWVPSSDIVEESDHYAIVLDLPGIEKDKIKIFMEEGILTVSGERNEERKAGSESYRRYERVQGAFKRAFRLPDNVVGDSVEADYGDGVLRIRVPKSEEALPHQIEVKVK